MGRKLYLVYPNKYPEDWILFYSSTELETVQKYCETTGKDITIDEFYENYAVFSIDSIEGKNIKSIIFE